MSSTLTCTIGVTAYPIANNLISVGNKIDSRSSVTFTINDSAGTATLSRGQPVLISDSVLGELFGGYIHKGVATNIYPNTMRQWAIDLVDMVWLADKRLSNSLYNNQYAAVIIVDQVQQILSAEGVTVQAALDYNHLQSDWTAGGSQLSNVVAATNAGDGNIGDGDLELAPAGLDVTYTDDFTTGTFSNVILDSDGDITLASTQGIMLTGTAVQSLVPVVQPVPPVVPPLPPNSYVYMEIWQGSSAIASGDQLQYDVWVSSTSPAQTAGIDGICSDGDGATIRDFSPTIVDQEKLPAHPATDLSGFATDRWYTRTFDLTPMHGKTLKIITASVQSSTNGTYTAYFRHVKQLNGSGGLKTTFFETSLQTNAVNSISFYTNILMKQVTVYETSGYRQCPTLSISPVAIVQTSNIDWVAPPVSTTAIINGVTQTVSSKNSTLPTLTVQTSIDNGATWQPATQYQPIPNLLPGMSVGSRNVLIQQVFTMAGPDPTLTPTMLGLKTVIQTSYNATKTDVIQTEMLQADWNAGTKTHVVAQADNTVTLNQASRSWFVTTDLSDQTLYGVSGGNAGQDVQFGRLELFCNSGNNSNDARSRMDFAGTYDTFTAEIEFNTSTPVVALAYGLEYKTTVWSNALNSYGWWAYFIFTNVSGAGTLNLANGTNSSGGGVINITDTVAITIASGSNHRIKVVVSGTGASRTHSISMDDVLYITRSSSTYASNSGYLAAHFFNNSSSPPGAHSGDFSNFGVVANLTGTWQSVSKSLAPAGTVGTSLIAWEGNPDPTGLTSLAVSTSIDGGTTWALCTNGGQIPQLTPGLSLSGKSLLISVLFTSPSANYTPALEGLTAWVVGAFNATGTWVSPNLSLTPAQNAGSSVVNWNALFPSGGCSLSVKTSIDGGATYQSVGTAGSPIPGLITQPEPFADTFSTNSSSNYTQTFFTGGSSAAFTWDTANKRLLATQTAGEDGILEALGISSSDMVAMADFNYSDSGGVIARMLNTGHAYLLSVADASAASNANTAMLYAIGGGVGGGGFVTPTPLSVYGTSIAATHLPSAGLLATTTGGADIGVTTQIGSATGYGEIPALGTQAIGTDSPYGTVYYVEGGNTPGLLPQKTLDLLVGGNGETGLIPGGPIWIRIQQRWTNIEQSPGVYTWTFMDDAVTRCNAANVLVDVTIQTPPIWAATITYRNTVVPTDGATYIGTLSTAIVINTTYTHLVLNALTAGQTLVAGQEIAIEYGAFHQENVLVAGGPYSSGATSITVTALDGTPWKAFRNHASGVVTENAGGIYASGADTLTFIKHFISRYNNTTTNYVSSASQPALFISAIQHNEDYDLFGTNAERDMAPQAFVQMWQIVAPEIRTHHPTCKLWGPALRFCQDDGSGGTFGLNHMTTWTNTLFTYTPPGKWAGCISDGSGGTLLDALDFHFYRHGPIDADPADKTPSDGSLYPSMDQEILALKGVAASNGWPNFDVVCTETGWDIYASAVGATTVTVSFQQQADFYCGPLNSGNLTGHAGVYEMFRLNGGSHAFVWTMAPNSKAYAWTAPPWASSTDSIVQNLQTTSGGSFVFTKEPVYAAVATYITAHPQWGTPWASGGSIAPPSGKGWLLDSALLAAQKIVLGNWSPSFTLKYNATSGTMTATVYIRAYAYDTATSSYTFIGQCVLTAQVFTTTKTTYTVPAVSIAAFTFNSTQMLYVDCMMNVTANTGVSPTTLGMHLSTSGTAGVASDMAVGTPGYVSSVLGAAIAVDHASLSYTAVQGSSPPTQNVSVSNVGTASGSWTSAITYTSGSGWLSVLPISGTLGVGANTTVVCTIASTGLAVGTYNALITWTMGSTNVTTAVTLTITAASSKLAAAPTSLAFTANVGGGSPPAQNVVLTNSDTSSHPYSSAITYTSGTPGWLSVAPTSGTLTASGGTGTIVVTATTGGLVAGTYSATITWTMTTSSATTTVAFTVSAPAGLVSTLLGTAAINFTRNTYHRFLLSTIGSTIAASMDGVSLFSVTDTSIVGSGSAGLLVGQAPTHSIQCYQFRCQPSGEVVTGMSVLTKLTLTSTDPLNSPQVLDNATFVGGPTMGLGVLVPAINYQGTFVSANFNDLKTKSNYWWNILFNKQVVFNASDAIPAPWILQVSDTANTNILLDSASVEYSADLYRNRQTLQNVHGTSLQPQLFVGDGTTTSWPLSYPVAVGTVPLVVLNGIIQTVGIQGVDTGKQYYYLVGSRSITQDASQTVLTGLDTLIVTYTGSFLTTVTRDNATAGTFAGTTSQAEYALIDGTSGIIEAVEDLSQDIATASMGVAEAEAYGDSLLARFGVLGIILTAKTYKAGLQVGQQVSIFFPQHQLSNVQALITDVALSSQIAGVDGGPLYEWTITATSGPNLSSWQKLFSDVFS